MSEDWFEVMRVDCGIASISPFWIDVPPSSESIWFGTKITRMEFELRKILGLLCLLPGQYLDSRKVLKVFVIYNNVERID